MSCAPVSLVRNTYDRQQGIVMGSKRDAIDHNLQAGFANAAETICQRSALCSAYSPGWRGDVLSRRALTARC